VLGDEARPPRFLHVDVEPLKKDKTQAAPVPVCLYTSEGSQGQVVRSRVVAGQIEQSYRSVDNSIANDQPQIVVFSLDGRRKDAEQADQSTVTLPFLDGYILSGQNGNWMVSDFSQGGPPNSAPNVVSDFIAAGAASGDAVLFFEDKNPEANQAIYDKIHVIVTTLRGVDLPNGYTAMSPVFSIASNEVLPSNTNPTVLIVNPLHNNIDTQNLRICRLLDNRLKPLPTFFSNGATFAATPLDPDGALFASSGVPRIERYVLAQIPASSNPQSTPS
jgi:hypothetical protein